MTADIKDRLIDWLQSGDTGLSSRYMASVCAGAGSAGNHYPLDPSDFGRCYRFLITIPEARDNLDRLRDSGPVWAAYIDHWDEMERLYEEEFHAGKAAPKLYALMRRLRKEGGE